MKRIKENLLNSPETDNNDESRVFPEPESQVFHFFSKENLLSFPEPNESQVFHVLSKENLLNFLKPNESQVFHFFL